MNSARLSCWPSPTPTASPSRRLTDGPRAIPTDLEASSCGSEALGPPGRCRGVRRTDRGADPGRLTRGDVNGEAFLNCTRTGRSLPILVRSRFELGDELPVDDRP